MKRLVLAFGSFDILHLGHLHYLEHARKLGDRLVVVVARDKSIDLFKHRKPLFDEKSRLKMVSSLRIVDKAVLGNSAVRKSDTYEIIKKIRPDVIALGYDQRVYVPKLNRWLKKNRIDAKIVRINSSINDKIYKSSRIRKLLD